MEKTCRHMAVVENAKTTSTEGLTTCRAFVSWCHWSFPPALRSRQGRNDPQFTDEGTEVQRCDLPEVTQQSSW